LTNPLHILKQVWGYDLFRPFQEEIISSVLSKKDTLAFLPTGGGKSMCFQVPTLLLDGTCLVITPLIALMKDQVENLRKKNILASAIHSGLSSREIDIILDNVIYGQIKFLYVSPERLKTPLFIARVQKMNICLIAVDEAHCISQWGYDFRPPYLDIGEFRTTLPVVPPILALTASATPDVKADIIEKLSLKEPKVFTQSCARDNLSYSVFYHENKEKKILDILHKVPGTAIIYVRNRRKTESLSQYLTMRGIQSECYHAGLSFEDRAAKQDRWIKNKTRIIVATNAFGMGIDKPDVRLVIHVDLPENLEAYYQEAGRGGRDGRKSFAVLLYNQNDIKLLSEKVEDSFPEIDFIIHTYQCLANFLKVAVGGGQLASYDFDFDVFITNFKLAKRQAYNALKRLESEGIIEFNEAYSSPSRVMIIISNQELYQFQVKNSGMDKLIKVLLRIYGGSLFATFITINEMLLAKNLNVGEKEVRLALNALRSYNIIEYIEQKNQPQIVFLTPRMDAKNLPIDKKKMAFRKQVEESKSQTMIQYALNTKRCRSIIILEYFGETKVNSCGKCDVCLAQINSANSKPLQFQSKILKTLSGKEFSIEELIQSIAPQNEKAILSDLRLMLDMEEIRYNTNGNLELNTK
jgi:ATP-dependent DNA helicase RecQ